MQINLTVQSIDGNDVTSYVQGFTDDKIVSVFTNVDTGYTATSVVVYDDAPGVRHNYGVSASVSAIQAGLVAASQSEIDQIETAVALAANGAYVAPTGTNYLDATTTVKAALTALDTALTPLAVADLRTGTNNVRPTTAKTLADAGISFATTNIVALAGGTNSQLSLTATAGSKGFQVTGTVQTANDLNTIVAATAVTSASVMKALDVTMTTSGVSTDNMIEAARFTITSNVKNGVWVNAICGKIDLVTAGYVTGIAGVVCAELQLPSGGVTGGSGTYTCFEAEIGMDGVSNTTPVSAMCVNVWGAQAADFDTNGFLFDISGVTKASTKIFQDNNNTATQALRIRVNGTPYYILLSDTSD